ncbi:hypothetical protein ACS8MQ_08765 [Pseudomonas sp. MAHUQ-62]|uniref:hypothetical protein n=1 Tax=Pseudomonas sp. GCM10023245 TaxID=3252652 RepID=UPI00361F7229
MKWNQKASVQTALVTGFFLVAVSMGGGLFSLYQDNRKLSRDVSRGINEAIYMYSKSVNGALKESAPLDLSPNFSTFETVLDTMSSLNQEANIYDSTVNLTKIYRYVRRYGSEASKENLSVLINAYADSHQAANDYLLSALRGKPGAQAESEYAALLNARSKARAALQSFIINLGDDDFSI